MDGALYVSNHQVFYPKTYFTVYWTKTPFYFFDTIRILTFVFKNNGLAVNKQA